MVKTGQADLPLHGGKAPPWLFKRMKKLAGPISQIIVDEYGQEEYLKRLSDPYFFQSLGNVLGFDWHSSGLTTTVTGALKEALYSTDTGIKVAGGKGKTSKNTPNELTNIGDAYNLKESTIQTLINTSKISAKSDNNLIQDKYNLYHHSFFLSEKGDWSIIQQGMQTTSSMISRGYARRYHWFSLDSGIDLIENERPIASQKFHESVLNLTSKEARETRKASLDLIKENPAKLKKYLKSSGKQDKQKTLSDFSSKSSEYKEFELPTRHQIKKEDMGNFNALKKAYESNPETYEELLGISGIGAKTIRGLSLISNLIHGTSLDWQDPAKYSYAHGGKDGIPYPVNKKEYDKSIEILNQAVKEISISSKKSKKSEGLNNKDRLKTLRRLNSLNYEE